MREDTARIMKPRLRILLTAVPTVMAVAAPLAAASAFDLRSLFSPGQTTSLPDETNNSSAPPWSGESGASGHPTMQADAIRAAAADFRNCLERLAPQAERRGVSEA